MSDTGTTFADLAATCLEHLGREEAFLDATLDSLRRVRAAVVRNDLPGLAAALGRQAELARESDAVRAARARLRERAAAALGVAAVAVTLRLLAERVAGEEGRRLLDRREALRRRAEEVERFNQANAALVRQLLGLNSELLRWLTGGQTAGEGYGRTGAYQEGVCGPLLSAQG